MSDVKAEQELSSADREAVSPSPTPSTPPPVHIGSVSLTADPSVQTALAELKRQQDKDKAEQQAVLSQLLAVQMQLLSRLDALDARTAVPLSAAVATAPLQPSAATAPLPTVTAGAININPALLATPATVRLPQQLSSPAIPARPLDPPVARGLFTTTAATAADSTHHQPARPYNDEEKAWDRWVQDAKKVVKIEPFKGGTQDERRNIRTWVTSLSMQLDLIAGPRRADGTVDRDRLQLEQARVAITYLQEGALNWAVTYQMQCQTLNQPMRWDKMSFELMAKYEGQDHGLLRQQELQNLTYKRGRCTDLPKYEAEFDRLALLVHGSNMQIPAVDALLGSAFGQGIRRGDERLYESMLPVGSTMPQSLQEWKGRAESAMVRSQALQLGSHSRASGNQAAVHHMDVGDKVKSSGPAEATPPPSSTSVDLTELVRLLAAMHTQNSNKKPPSKKYQLTEEERAKLFAAKRCYCCYKIGHRANKCTHKATLPTRAPTADELN